MFDFTFSSLNVHIALYCAFLLTSTIIYSLYFLLRGKIKHGLKLNIMFFLTVIVLIVPYGIDHDFYALMDVVHNYDLKHFDNNYAEPIYGYIVSLVGRNYFLFRLLVWGGALCFFVFTSKRLGVNPNLSLAFIICSFTNLFAYARVTLSMAIYFWGLSFFLRPIFNHKKISILLGMSLMFISTFFHSSMWFMVAMTFTIIIPIYPWALILYLLFLPLVGSIIADNIMNIFSYGIGFDAMIDEKLEGYSVLDRNEVLNSNGVIRETLGYLIFATAIPLIICKYFTIRQSGNKIICNLMKIIIFTTLGSLIFLFIGLSNNIFFYRLLYMTFIPISITIPYLYSKGLVSRRLFGVLLCSGVINQLFLVYYAVYIS